MSQTLTKTETMKRKGQNLTIVRGADGRIKKFEAIHSKPEQAENTLADFSVVNGVVKTESEMLRVSPSMAQEWIDKYPFPRNRPLKQSKVQEYADSIQSGSFTPGTQIRFGILNDQRYLINGQHRLHAIVRAGKTLQVSVVYNYVNSEAALNALYYREDRNKPRRFSDLIRATGMAGETGIGQVDLARLGVAIRIMSANYGQPSGREYLSDEDTYNLMQPWIPAAQEYMEMIAEASLLNKKILGKAAVIAVGITITRFTKDKNLALDFFKGIALDDGLRKGDPRKTLLDTLKDAYSTGSKKYSLAYPWVCRAVALAWNAFASNEKLTFIRVAQSNINDPIKINGLRRGWRGLEG